MRLDQRGPWRAWIGKRLLAVALAWAVGTSQAWAEANAPLAEARRLLDAGQAAEAAALLDRDLLRFAGEADFDYLLGLALYRAGRLGEALFAFERVLMADPTNLDARLKAAEAAAGRGGSALARDLLAPLAGTTLPAPAQAEVERIAAMAAAPAADLTAFQGHLLVGLGTDSNISNGPDRNSLVIPAIGPVPVSLGAAARTADKAGLLGAGGQFRRTLAEGTWLTGSGSLQEYSYPSHRAQAERIANADLGLLGGTVNAAYGAALLAQHYWTGGVLYRRTAGGRAHWGRSFADASRLGAYVQYLDFDYPEHDLDNAARTIVGLSREHAPAASPWTLQYGGYAGKEVARMNPHFGYRLWGVHLGATWAVAEDFSVSAGAVYESRRHLAMDALYRVFREDRQLSLGLAADYRLGERWHLVPRYSYTRNPSNTELYRYNRRSFMLQLRWDFDHEKI